MTIACDGKLIEKIIAGLDKVSTFIAVLALIALLGGWWFGVQANSYASESNGTSTSIHRKTARNA